MTEPETDGPRSRDQSSRGRPVRAVAAVCLVLTGACATGSRQVPTHIKLPERWAVLTAQPGNAQDLALERWWTTFQDPVLDSLIARAVDGNLGLQTASARIREARAARGIAAAAALPQVDAVGSYGRLRASEAVPPLKGTNGRSSPFGPRDQNLFEAGFDASWEIDVFGGVRREREAALAEAQAAEAARRDVLVTLLADVARSYVELRGVQRQAAILDETIQSQQDTLSLVRARFNAGLATDLDVARAEGLLAGSVSQQPVLGRLAGEAIHRISVLLGKDPEALTGELETRGAIPPAPPEVPATLPSELLSRRPDLRRAERELAAATARTGVARADLFPRFAILGRFGRRSDEAGDLASFGSQFWSIVPGVRWSLLSGGRVRANIRVQDARQDQARLAYDAAILHALQEVSDALLAHARELERQGSLRTAAAANRRALDVSLDRYTSGLDSFLSVLDAQRSVQAADDAVVQSERNAAVSLIAVYKSLGGGWSRDETR